MNTYVCGCDGILNFDRISATECGLVSIVGGEWGESAEAAERGEWESSGTKKLDTEP